METIVTVAVLWLVAIVILAPIVGAILKDRAREQFTDEGTDDD